MFLSLEEPGGDKHVSLFAHNLKGEKNYRTPGYSGFGKERGKFNWTVRAVNKTLGKAIGRGNLDTFSILFNQFDWKGTSGWEYWTDNYVLVLRHALAVASELKQPLHLHKTVLEKVLHGAGASGITFAWKEAEPVTKLHPGENMRYVNEQIKRGEFVVLSNVVIPEALAVPEVDQNMFF